LKYVGASPLLEGRNAGRVAGQLGLVGLVKLLGLCSTDFGVGLFPGLGILSALTRFSSGDGMQLLGGPRGPLSLPLQSERTEGRGE
jgi:hypothetical protein